VPAGPERAEAVAAVVADPDLVLRQLGPRRLGLARPREVNPPGLAVLEAAAEFAASRPQAPNGGALKVAEAWEAWVKRPYDGHELTNAF